MTGDVIISAIPGETGLVDMAELGCSSTWETKDIMVCGSEEKRVGEDIMSVTLGEADVLRILKVASVTEWVTQEAVVSG